MKYKILFTFAVVMITAIIASWDSACARDPQIVGGADTPIWAQGITVSNGYAYVADLSGGLQVFDVSFPTAPTPVHNVDEHIHWSPSDVVVSDGYAFTATSSSFPDLIGGLYVYDVSNPAAPRVVALAGVLPPSYPGGVLTYDIELSGAFAYVAAYLEGLLIFDISNPASPVMVGNPPMPSAVRGLDVAGSYAYLADWENGLSILDVSNPSSPVLLGSLDVPGNRSTDVAVAGAYAYLVDWETGLHVIDISTPAAPVLVTTLIMPTPRHPNCIELSGPYAYVVAGGTSQGTGLYIIDISTPSAPLLVASLDPPESEAEWHSWSDLHLYGPYVFVAAGPAGFRVIDPGDYRPQRGSDLSITKSGTPNPVPVGDRLTYQLDVTNFGPETATGVTVRDTLPPQINLVSANSPAGSCSSPIGNEITCGLNDLPSGGTTEIQIVVTPTAEARLLNQAVVSGNEVDPILVNNEVALHTTACRVDLAVKVYHRPEPVPLGAYLAYTVTVTNNGYVDADGVVLTDTFPGSVEFLAAAMPQEVGYCSPPAGNQVQCFIDKLSPRQEVTATVVVRTTAEGRLGNTASVSGGGSDCNPTDNTSTTYATVGTLLVRDIPAAWSPQLAIDSEGHAHVASVDVDSSGDTHLLYSTNVSGQWVTRALGDDVSLDAFLRGSQAIAVDSAGHVHISYFSDERFRYASNASGIWSWRTLDFADMKIGIAASAIAVDNQDKVHAVFCDDDACDYFTNRSGSWQGEPAGCAGRAVAIALDSNDVPHISCHQRGWVWYSTQSGDGTWERHSVDVGCCQCEAMFTSIALDALDRPHLSYTAAEDPNCLSQQEVAKYALLDNGSWAITDLDDGEFYSAGTAVTVDIEDKVHVPYYYKPSETLKYAVGSDGTWDTRHVQGIGFSEARFGSSAAADRSGHVHFVFEEMQRDGTSQARYAWTLALADGDHDNVGDSQEKGPAGNDNTYDGNQDGIADGQQENVASLHCYDQRYYVTLVSPAGTVLAEVGTTDNPSPADAPSDDEFPYGFYDFIVYGVDAGDATTVTLILPAGENPTTYWKYGPTPGNPTPHWYEFLFDGQTGAEITGNVIVLHFVDGGRGDDDLTANGIIIDQGAPAMPAAAQPGAAGNGGGGGGGFCFIATAA